MDNSYRTAVSRKSLSAPAKYLLDKGFLHGHILDYGCGKGDLKKFIEVEEGGWIFSVTQYDPYYHPTDLKGLTFDTIYCGYVLNCIRLERDRKEVLDKISILLGNNGIAYIAVRRDVDKLKKKTKLGTTQINVNLNLPVIYERKNRFAIYKMWG